MTTPWAVLGVHRKSKDPEIQYRFREMAWLSHPDRGGNKDSFVELNLAYQAIKDKKSRDKWLAANGYRYTECKPCKGQGATATTVSLTEKLYAFCPKCNGSGLTPKNIKEKTNAIELSGAGKAGGAGRSNKRRP